MTRPRQAAILCGGLGTRMRPLTDTMPKPMAPVNGRPFLSVLVAQLRDQGIQRVVLLTGYRGEMIHEYFDGREWGVDIGYSDGPAEWDTGRRIWEARDQLDSRFLLLYGDNFVPFNLEKLWAFHKAHDPVVVSLLVQAKVPGNILLRADGRVAAYDSRRSTPGLDHVEIGYMIVERDRMLALFGRSNESLSSILAKLAEENLLAGMPSRDPYQSISDLDRWRRAEKYLDDKKILLIDRDGTINRRPERGTYITQWRDFHWIPESVKAMSELAANGFRFIVLTNQAGIARGVVKADIVQTINLSMIEALRDHAIDVIDVYVCPHHWDEGCDCRKPAPGLFFRASREHLLRMDRTVYIGDDPRDALAAYNAESLSVLIGPDRDLGPPGGVGPTFSAATLLDAVPWITSRFAAWAADS